MYIFFLPYIIVTHSDLITRINTHARVRTRIKTFKCQPNKPMQSAQLLTHFHQHFFQFLADIFSIQAATYKLQFSYLLRTQQEAVISVELTATLFNKPTRCSWTVTFITALLDYSTCFGCFFHPSSGVQQLYMQPLVQVHCKVQQFLIRQYKVNVITCYNYNCLLVKYR